MIEKSEVLVPYSELKMIGGQLPPLHHELHTPCPFFPNASDKNFEIAILLKIIQKSDSKNSGVDIAPRAQGQAL